MLTTLSPPAFVTEGLLLLLCIQATAEWDTKSKHLAFYALLGWMLISKFVKLLGHYVRYPIDFLLLPVSIVFGYFHGFVKFYAMWTLNVVSSLPTLPFTAFRGFPDSGRSTDFGGVTPPSPILAPPPHTLTPLSSALAPPQQHL